MKELLEICDALKKLGDEPCAMATVIHVEGSAYRRPGARMLMTPDGQSWGMVSGGCLEHDVLDHARRAMQSGQPRIVRYDSTSDDDIIFGTGLGCNGIIDVFIEPVSQQFRESFVKAVDHTNATRQPSALATVVDGTVNFSRGDHAILGNILGRRWSGADNLSELLERQFDETTEPRLIDSATKEGARIFVQPILPPVQLLIFGGWLDVVPLIRISKEIGFQVTVVDSRQRLSSIKLFREADAILLCSPEEALSQIKFDDRTIVVLMNHHFERDQDALSALTKISVRYLGMLGPKRRQEKLLNALRSDGVTFSAEFLSSLRGPVGLDLGAKTPEEIALSILSEILSVLNERNAKPIRERAVPLHHPVMAPIRSETLALAHA